MAKAKPQLSLFDDLVSNAIDFARRSIQELPQSPKYSMIHFTAAVELFLKARLLKEHWSLLIARQEKASLTQFKSGDFQSVSILEAIERLRNVAGVTISEAARTAFRAASEHRNRLIHFLHADFSPNAAAHRVETVVADQCKAWYYLNVLLSGTWKYEFQQHESTIARLDKAMHRLRVYLKAKYEALQPEILRDRQAGTLFEKCFSCGFTAAHVRESIEPLFVGRCRVCASYRSSLHVPCSECGETIISEELGEGTCDGCGAEISLDYLLDEYGPDTDPKEDSEVAYCSNCENTEQATVIPYGDAFLCLSCLQVADFVGNCGYCSTLVTDIKEVDSYLNGCLLCDGAIKDD